MSAWSTEDVAYAHDLGLVALDDDGTPRIANPIYAEVVPRHLNHAVQMGLPHRMAWYVDAGGGLDVAGLIAVRPRPAPAARRSPSGACEGSRRGHPLPATAGG